MITKPVLAIFVILAFFTRQNTAYHLPDEGLTVPELIKFWGYPVESHEVTTEDGYILTLHRIPHGRKNMNTTTTTTTRPVVFLQHGLLGSSSNWLINLPHQSLGFILADNGFDVFLGNIRGNTYSKKHKYLNSDDVKFWDFSFDEHAKYDLPAMVDFALNMTGEKQLSYVGHSMGTMMALAKLSEDTDSDFHRKIKSFVALAPVAKLRHVTGPIEILANLEGYFKLIFKLFDVHSFLPSSVSLSRLTERLCMFKQSLCNRMAFMARNDNEMKNFNQTRRSVYLDHSPAGTSVKNMYHFMQLIKSEEFQKYDYGMWGNLRRYASVKPSPYDLTRIRSNITIFYGPKDWLTHPIDVRWLVTKLPSHTQVVKVNGYNHFDFLWGLNAKDKVYDSIVKIFKQLE